MTRKDEAPAKASSLAINKDTPIGKIREICVAIIKNETGHYGKDDDELVSKMGMLLHEAAWKGLQSSGADALHVCVAAAALALHYVDVINDSGDEQTRPKTAELLLTMPLATTIVQ